MWDSTEDVTALTQPGLPAEQSCSKNALCLFRAEVPIPMAGIRALCSQSSAVEWEGRREDHE